MPAHTQASDIGVARLGAGCPRLRHLDMSGFVNLSDGMQRDFAFTGIQVPYICTTIVCTVIELSASSDPH